MKKINISNADIRLFLDWIENDFNRLSGIKLSFIEFKELFCKDTIDFSPTTNINEYKEIYLKISSSESKFYSKLRGYIIDSFLKEYSYCPYCWKTPLIYFDNNNKSKRMFQFDHFFSKNYFNNGVINFYNLIPSCNACNHIKSDLFPINEIFHPYFWWVKVNWNSVDIIWDDYDTVSYCYKDINWKKTIFATYHWEYFNLNQMYQQSIRDTANVFDFIRDKNKKIKDEIKRIPNRFKDSEEAKKYFFEHYYSPDKNEVTHYQNWKLKKDLIDNLKIKIKK